MKVDITIVGETSTRAVEVSGAIDDMMIVYWLLGEARRIIEKRAAKREAGASSIVVVPGGMVS